MRLQKALSRAGISSRRKTGNLIREGRVTVNGRIVLEPGTLVEAGEDDIKVDGRLIRPPAALIYMVLNKPRGFVSTTQDPEGRPTVLDLIKRPRVRLFPVGRLDYNTEGLLLITNDGDLAHKLLHPRYRLPRVYHVKVKGVPCEKDLEKVRQGIHLEPGVKVRAKGRVLQVLKNNAWLEMMLKEGRNREIRRICQVIGHPALHIRRVQFGPAKLKGLPVGKSRHLTEKEVHALKRAVDTQTAVPGRQQNS